VPIQIIHSHRTIPKRCEECQTAFTTGMPMQNTCNPCRQKHWEIQKLEVSVSRQKETLKAWKQNKPKQNQ